MSGGIDSRLKLLVKNEADAREIIEDAKKRAETVMRNCDEKIREMRAGTEEDLKKERAGIYARADAVAKRKLKRIYEERDAEIAKIKSISGKRIADAAGELATMLLGQWSGN